MLLKQILHELLWDSMEIQDKRKLKKRDVQFYLRISIYYQRGWHAVA
jgi:hypothetical protein